MKKIIAIMLAMASTAAFSATAMTSGTEVTTTACIYLKEAITPRLSTDVVGSFSCTASKVGIATAAVKGKGRAYGLNSDGGAIAEYKTADEKPFTNQGAAETLVGTSADKQAGTATEEKKTE